MKFIEDNLNKVFYVKCMITKVNEEWFYLGCPVCPSKLHADGDHQFCLKCSKVMTATAKRFKIGVSVQDPSGEGKFVILDHAGFGYFDKTAEQLYFESSDKEQILPTSLLQLEGLHLTFLIKITEYNYSKESKYFTVVEIQKEKIKDDNSASTKEETNTLKRVNSSSQSLITTTTASPPSQQDSAVITTDAADFVGTNVDSSVQEIDAAQNDGTNPGTSTTNSKRKFAALSDVEDN
ncbi:unnamed protein product [Linum trigynum]|uniref:Replication factor A C-terminal domain-containing protein n=1 Tax=Linum trigynum TaxID=586398 RepID=A0AAV2F5Z3_9ROSI